jgi:hypothetical protein
VGKPVTKKSESYLLGKQNLRIKMEENGLEVCPGNEFCCLSRLMMCQNWVLRGMFGQRGRN